ncbi:NmrA family transcriptional regulator [Intrasporangium oryzae NRRL B-24470]|uniref:NmrA family transcriptional regulator n=1 Tax=Intrasporangium oryzae NRRL B-24470 TaxID=1386089 RepID=W9GH10_9MICO|nr:NAD(P)H-binding protein [Intrasporangium oryzae]EWT03164.1 NmrA family transcriptional regulator [Intrasporangium oryzae NRRL B-24470]
MRVTIFGATGSTGQLLVERALGQGHLVTAFARNPDRLEPRPGLTVVGGAIDDPDAVGPAVSGADVVISLLGPGRDRSSVPSLVPGMRTIVTAMEAADVKRLVATLTPSAPDTSDGKDLRVTLLVKAVRFTLPYAYNAVRGMDEVIRSSALDWTIVRVPVLHDNPTSLPAVTRSVGEPGSMRLARAGLAAFLLDAAQDPAWIRRAPLLADTPPSATLEAG